MIYLTSRNGRCVIVNRDVVKLQVDLHCEKKPPCFPFPVKPKQKRDVWVCSVEPHTREVWAAGTSRGVLPRRLSVPEFPSVGVMPPSPPGLT